MNVSLQIEENRWNYSLVQNNNISMSANADADQHDVTCNEVSDHSVTQKIADNVWNYSIESTGDIIETYDGSYDVTPTGEQQILLTKHLRMAENVIVEPIPSNYGLITWNGSVLTVS